MSELISGKEALIALANGEDVQLRNLKDNWYKEWTDYSSFKFKTWIGFFIEGESIGYEFRLKPKTITLNGIEVPATFEPKAGEQAFYITAFGGYDALVFDWQLNDFGYWRTEEEVKQVVKALRSIFK